MGFLKHLSARTVEPRRRAILAVLVLLGTGHGSLAIDESVLTEINAFGEIGDKELEQLDARRDVVFIDIEESAVEPRDVTVTRNTVVVFRNLDPEEKHFFYITPDDNNDLKANALTEMILPQAMWAATYTYGEYPFYCARHSDREAESGRIIVSD